MEIKMPKDKEKTKDSQAALNEFLNLCLGERTTESDYIEIEEALHKSEVEIKRSTTQEEDDSEWMESIQAAVADNGSNDDFIPPSYYDTIMLNSDRMAKAMEKEELHVDEPTIIAFPNQLKKEKTDQETEQLKKSEEVEPKPSFWNRFSKMVGIPEKSEATAKKSEPKAEDEASEVKFDLTDDEDDWDDEPVQEADEIVKPSINFDDYANYSAREYDEELAETVRETVEQGQEKEKREGPSVFNSFFMLLGEKLSDLNEKRRESQKIEAADSEIEEPESLEKEARRYARPVGNITVRSRIAFVLSAVMVLLVAVFEITGRGWFGIGENAVLMTGVLLVMMLLVIFFCVEVPLRGICSIIRGKVTAESLVAISCFVTLLDGVIILISRNAERGLPFVVVSALSVMFGMRGLRSYYIGMRNSLRVASKVKSPWGIVIDDETVLDRNVLKKLPNTTDGFYKNLIRRDICEHIYTYAAPIMLITALVFAFIGTVVRGRGGEFIHALSALVGVTASFSCMSAYANPFRLVSIITRRLGCAIAGWTGADKMFSTDGAFITDTDLFPKGTQSVSGMRKIGDITDYKAMEYVGSMIIASGSELEHPFRDMLRDNGVNPVYVDSFSCYEGGGIGGMIHNDNVLVGTAAFMNLMGVRMPEDLVRNSGIFLAVNRRLAAVFTVNSVPSNAVQNSLLAMRGTRMNMLLASRDFTISPKTLQQRFKVPMDGVEYIPLNDCYRMTQTDELEKIDTAGIISLGSLSSFAETVAKAVQLRQITLMNTAVSILGSVAGLFLVFYMCWNGPITSVTSWAMTLFMFAMHFVTIVLSNLVKRKK